MLCRSPGHPRLWSRVPVMDGFICLRNSERIVGPWDLQQLWKDFWIFPVFVPSGYVKIAIENGHL